MSIEEPEFVKVKAIDVKPYHWVVWCTVEGGTETPFANEIVHRAWTENGLKICFGLESHNSYGPFAPEEELELVPYRSQYMTDEHLESLDIRDSEKMAKRPFVQLPCSKCGK